MKYGIGSKEYVDMASWLAISVPLSQHLPVPNPCQSPAEFRWRFLSNSNIVMTAATLTWLSPLSPCAWSELCWDVLAATSRVVVIVLDRHGHNLFWYGLVWFQALSLLQGPLPLKTTFTPHQIWDATSLSPAGFKAKNWPRRRCRSPFFFGTMPTSNLFKNH